MKYLLMILITFNVYAVEQLTVQPQSGATMKSKFDTRELALENLRNRITKKKWMRCDWLLEANELSLTKTIADENMEMVVHYCHPKNFTYSIENIDAEIAEKEAKETAQITVNNQLKEMSFGKTLYAKIMLLNKSKGLSKVQRKQLRKDLNEIRDDLFDGDICGAKEEISALNPNEVTITTLDLTKVLSLIANYKTCI